MQMKSLTPTILHELVERIDVYHVQGTGKNQTQRLVIHYKFVCVLDFPRSPALPKNVVLNSRQGLEIEYPVEKPDKREKEQPFRTTPLHKNVQLRYEHSNWSR